MNFKLPAIPQSLTRIFMISLAFIIVGIAYFAFRQYQSISNYQVINQELDQKFQQLSKDYDTLKTEDQRKKNLELAETIKQIKATYKSSVSVYELLQDLKIISKNTGKLDEAYAKIVNFLSNENYSSASTALAQLNKDILVEKEKATVITIPSIPTANLPQTNTPPASGYSRQSVKTEVGTFVVSLISADLGSTRVIVDTASDSECGNNCPVMSLGAYVARSGAYAGVNGSYFCPATYPSCASKTNSYDLLVMNKNKHYFNSDNNVYSNNPAVIFGGGYIRFVSAASQWGRDTGIDSMLSNYPLLVEGGNLRFGSGGDSAYGGRGNRSFVANKGNQVFIGVAHSTTMSESAQVLKALGMENALNLDDGGSTALWSGGYKLGPGRDLPNAILFVRK